MSKYTLYDEIRAHEREIKKIRARAQRRADRLGKPFELTMREWRGIKSQESCMAAVKRILATQPA